MREGLIAYIERYFKENHIDLKYYRFNLNKIHDIFKLSVEETLSKETIPSSLRQDGFIKVDRDNHVYIEMTSYANTCFFLSDQYVKTEYKGIHVREEEFNKAIRGMNLIYYKQLKQRFPEFLIEFKNLEDPVKLVKEDFKIVLEEAKEFDRERKQKQNAEKYNQLLENIESISFINPDGCVSESKVFSSEENQKLLGTNHDNISVTDRYNVLLDLNPEKVLRAKGMNGDLEYLVCLYNLEKQENMDSYALVMEPFSSYGYTKTAYFNSKIGINQEQFSNITKLYLELDRQDITSLANTVRTCHKNMDRYNDTINGLLLGEYKTPSEKTRITFAKENAEEIQPISYSKK